MDLSKSLRGRLYGGGGAADNAAPLARLSQDSPNVPETIPKGAPHSLNDGYVPGLVPRASPQSMAKSASAPALHLSKTPSTASLGFGNKARASKRQKVTKEEELRGRLLPQPNVLTRACLVSKGP